MRGVGHLVQRRVDEGARAVVCASGGNAGLAATLAARACGVPVTIVVPHHHAGRRCATPSPHAAPTVVVHGSVWDEAHEHAVAARAGAGRGLRAPLRRPAAVAGPRHADRRGRARRRGASTRSSLASAAAACWPASSRACSATAWHDVPVIAVETEAPRQLRRCAGRRRAGDAAGASRRSPPRWARAASLPRLLELAREHPIAQRRRERRAGGGRVLPLRRCDARAGRAGLRRLAGRARGAAGPVRALQGAAGRGLRRHGRDDGAAGAVAAAARR